MFTEKEITYFVTFLSLFISTFAAFTAWMFNKVSLRKATRQDHDNMAIDINKTFINNPELFAIYDNHPVSQLKSMEPLEIAKREAMLLTMLNSSHVVFDFYNGIIVSNKQDKSHWTGWDQFTQELFRESSEARSIYSKYRNQFSAKFIKYADKLLENY